MKISGVTLASILSFFVAIPAFANLPKLILPTFEAPVLDLDADSEPLFDLSPTNKTFTNRFELAARLSDSELQELMQGLHISPNGYIWIRLYLGEVGSTDFPNHAFNVKEEFATVTWFDKPDHVREWDAFPISSGYPHKSKKPHKKPEGQWSPEGNFSITEAHDKDYKSSLFPKRPSGKNGGAPMPYAMEIDGPVKMHVGVVEGKPISHGCFRIPSKKGWLVNTAVKKIGLENVLVTSYRGKKELNKDDEQSAYQIRVRIQNPMKNEDLSFYGF